MKRSITRWMTTLSTAAVLGVPAIGMAQTPTPQTPPQQQTTPQQPPTQAQPAQPTAKPDAERMTPEEHLSQAKAAFEKIQADSLTGSARTQITELKRHLTALERSGASATESTPGAARASATWATHTAAIDKVLTELLGPGSATGTTGTTGMTGSKPATPVTLDDATRAALMEVRTHIIGYAAGKSGTKAPKDDAAMKSDAEPAAAAAPQPAPTEPAPPAATPQQPTPSPSQQPSEPSQPQPPAAAPQQPATPEQPATTPAAGAQLTVDQEGARRHLSAARGSLNQLTQLPAAAQLAGEGRTQVTQLIANFNELITTQAQWRASYDKVAANLTTLLGPASTDAEATAAAPAPTAATPPAPGAVGTSGTVELDPAIRAKLVELRRHLAEFEKAMGGPAQN